MFRLCRLCGTSTHATGGFGRSMSRLSALIGKNCYKCKENAVQLSPSQSSLMVLAAHFVLCSLLLSALIPVLVARAQLRGTTLTTAAHWTLAALLLWMVASCADWIVPGVPDGVVDQLWYWTAVISLCPPIAVLGARSPTHKVWNYFILMPLVAVLGWPAMTLWAGLPEWRPIQVESPVFVGFALVIVMGCGNYVGTRFTSVAFLTGAAIGLILVPFATFRPDWYSLVWCREMAVILLVTALFRAWLVARRTVSATTPFDAVWWDFQDSFGLVWSVRILERLQEQGRRDGWPCEWSPGGVEWNSAAEIDRLQTEQQMTHTLRWLLRRFVDAHWLTRRGLAVTETSNIDGDVSNANRVDS